MKDFRPLPASAFEEFQLNYVISNTVLILRETLPQQNIFSESKTEEKHLAKSISYPLYGLFRFLYENDEKAKNHFKPCCQKSVKEYLKLAICFCTLWKFIVSFKTRKNSQQSYQFKTTIYRQICDAADEKIGNCLLRDLDLLEKENTNIFLWLLPDIYREFKSIATNNTDLLRITLRCIDAKNVRDILYSIAQGKLTIFKQDGLIDCIRQSLEFETYEQFCLWQIVQAHDVPLRCIQVWYINIDYGSRLFHCFIF